MVFIKNIKMLLLCQKSKDLFLDFQQKIVNVAIET
jgi:hypothetical protein